MRRWIAVNAQALEAAAIALAVFAVGQLAQRETLPAAIAAGALTTLTLLAIAHVVLWPWRDRIPRPASYVVGVSCMGAGLLLMSRKLHSTSTLGLVVSGDFNVNDLDAYSYAYAHLAP